MRWLLAELVVVVFGILIAFQIEAWWDERALRSEERVVLGAIHADLKADLENLNRSHEHRRRKIDGLDEFVRYVVEEENRTAAGIAQRWRVVTRVLAYYPAANAYQGLKGTGRLHIVSSQALSSRLLDYYAVQQTRLLGMQNLANKSWRKLRDFAKPDIYYASDAFRSPTTAVFAVPIADDPDSVLDLAIELPADKFPSNPLLLPEIGDYRTMLEGILYNGEKLKEANVALQALIGEHLATLE